MQTLEITIDNTTAHDPKTMHATDSNHNLCINHTLKVTRFFLILSDRLGLSLPYSTVVAGSWDPVSPLS